MRTIEDLRISPAPWLYSKSIGAILSDAYGVVYDEQMLANDARLIAAAPELLAFAAAYYERHKRNAVKVNPQNGDKYQDGLMVMCKQALVKAGMMDESEVWEEEE